MIICERGLSKWNGIACIDNTFFGRIQTLDDVGGLSIGTAAELYPGYGTRLITSGTRVFGGIPP